MNHAAQLLQAAEWKGSRLGLERIAELLDRLGRPQDGLRFIHVAGTNGKGSVCAMLDSVLREAGCRTGVFTSPHLRRFNERISAGGREITDGELAELAEQLRPHVEQMADKPTEFELSTAMALLFFQKKHCDPVILEVGLGGRLDATNVIPAPAAAVITSIGLDHTEVLGDTIEKIAAEKAGIIKPGTSVVLCGQDPAVEEVVREKCRSCGAAFRVTETARLLSADLSGQTVSYRGRENLRLGLLGTYQGKNAAVVLDTLDVLRERGLSLPEEAVRRGLERAVWPGRFELLRRQPPVFVDGAHNPDGAEELSACLTRYLPGQKVVFVMGVMADKDYPRMIRQLLPFAAEWIAVTPENGRALPSARLCAAVKDAFPGPVFDAGDVREGLSLALEQSGADGAVCAFGSLYMAGDVRAYFGRE